MPLLLTFFKALSLKQLLIYLRQHAAKNSALGMFKCQRIASLGSKGRHLCYLSSIGVKKVLVELALHNKTYHSY